MSFAQSVMAIAVALAACTDGAASAQEAQAPSAPSAAAQEAQQAPAAQARQPESQSKDDKAGARPAPKRTLHPRRRSVQQIIATVPPPAVAPMLTPPAAPAPIPVPGAGLQPVYPPPPAPLNSCTGNLCTDSSGNTYNTGTGSAAINSQGRLCNRVGDTMQCF